MHRLSTNSLVTVGVLLGIALVLVNAALQALWDEATNRDEDAAILDELYEPELATPATSSPPATKSTRKAEGQKAG